MSTGDPKFARACYCTVNHFSTRTEALAWPRSAAGHSASLERQGAAPPPIGPGQRISSVMFQGEVPRTAGLLERKRGVLGDAGGCRSELFLCYIYVKHLPGSKVRSTKQGALSVPLLPSSSLVPPFPSSFLHYDKDFVRSWMVFHFPKYK